MTKVNNHEPEFSFILYVDKIPAAGMEERLIASAAQCDALTARFNLLALTNLHATLKICMGRAGSAVEVTGTMIADVVQSCIVTLDPVHGHIEADIEVLFAMPDDVKTDAVVMQGELDGEDVETIMDGRIDLGELIAQHLGITINPYPRKEGVNFTGIEFNEPKASINPFAKLVELKKKPVK